MVQSQFALSWNSYESSICKGFSSLQQNGEFVDMTLAADGHYVKVHQILMALASPYIKELISSAPCNHPVLFLNNVSHRTLSLLLVYIYTGEVQIPADNLTAFANAAKALHIKGLENITGNESMTLKVAENVSQMEDGELFHVSGTRRMVIPASDGTEQISLPASARKILIKKELISSTPIKQPQATQVTSDARIDNTDIADVADIMDDHVTGQDSDDEFNVDESLQKSRIKNTSVTDVADISKEKKRKCVKCGASPAEDGINLFRVLKPGVRNLVRCEQWAKYIFPERNVSSVAFQHKLFSEHRMLCERHFKDEDFTDGSKKYLMRTAVPCDMKQQLPIFSLDQAEIPGPSKTQNH